MTERLGKSALGNEGIALFLVLWVLMFLSVIVGEFCYAMRTELNIAKNFKEEAQAYYVARAGLCQGLKMVIENERQPRDVTRLTEEVPELEGEVEGEGGGQANSVRINVPLPPAPFGQGQYELKIGNESGKVNINQANGELLMVMLNAFDLDETDKEVIVDSIQDWRDEDDLHRLNGAESDYYNTLRTPYDAKNAPFDSVEELLLVKGVTPELFYGGLKDMVTVFPSGAEQGRSRRSRRVARTASSRINLNAAPPQLLLALPLMTEELVQAILDYRESRDFVAESDILEIVGPDVYQAIQAYITLDLNPYYTLTATGLLPDSRVRETVEMLVEIDSRYPKQYRVVRWIDDAR